MIVFGFEDDGTLYFQKKNGVDFEHQFNSRLLGGVMKELNSAIAYMTARGYKV